MSTTKATGELRSIALVDIEVREDHNPRRSFDAKKLKELARSIEARGVSTPITVKPNDNGEGPAFVLIAGERRYRAAVLAEQERVDAIVKSAGAEISDLATAVLENAGREDLDPVDEARAYRRLMDEEKQTHGTRKGVAEFLGVAQKRVTERLQILDLPDQLHEDIASGAIPVGAISGLRVLNAALPELAVVVAKFLLGDQSMVPTWRRRGWSDLMSDPVDVACVAYSLPSAERPEGVYENATNYPIASFELSEKAAKDREKLLALQGRRACDFVSFVAADVEAARVLGAALVSERMGQNALIIGQDVADQLAGDIIGRQLKQARAEAREAKGRAEAAAAAEVAGTPAVEESASEKARREAARAQEERRKGLEQQEQERAERRRKAVAYNQELGAAVVKGFARVKLDLDVVKVLATLPFGDMLDRIAMRGARYGFPGFPEIVTSGDWSETVYLDADGCLEKLQGQLANVKAPAELAGRLVGLVVMARFADEEAVHPVERAGWDVWFPEELGWSDELIDAIDALAAERVPEQLTAAKRAERAELVRERQERAELIESIKRRLDEDAEALTVADCQTLRDDIARAYPDWTPEATELTMLVVEIEDQLRDETAEGSQATHARNGDGAQTTDADSAGDAAAASAGA